MKRKFKLNNKLVIVNNKNNQENTIRVLYKKVGQMPEVKIIKDISKLKQAIVKQNLSIIPYENLFIICKNPRLVKNMRGNIVLTFKSIYGDFILIDIDRKKREFISLEQEDIIWYTSDLINKSFINSSINNKKYLSTKTSGFFERCFDSAKISDTFDIFSTNKLDNLNYSNEFNYNNNFKNTLINVLINIELVLASILRNNDSKNRKIYKKKKI